LEEELGYAPERLEILKEILTTLLELRPRMTTDEFLDQWQSLLAFQEQPVQVESAGTPTVNGQLVGLDTDGSLRLRNEHGEFVTVRFGDVRLRPVA
jgi:biotin-(acetyl-CoA carboxylase) ligase